MREDIIVEQAIAKEIIHEDVEMVRRFVYELPLSDVTVVDGEKAVLDCRHGHVVRRHVVHGARSARRHRLLLPGYRGERCLAAAHARPLIRPEDTLLQAVCAAGTSRSVRRDAIQRDALLARPDVERRSDDRGPRTSTFELIPSCHGSARSHGNNIFRMARPTNFKFGLRMEDDDPHQPQAS